MRIKIGKKWFACSPEQPIMVELTETDKRNIANMAESATCYAMFDSADTMSKEDKLAWMSEE